MSCSGKTNVYQLGSVPLFVSVLKTAPGILYTMNLIEVISETDHERVKKPKERWGVTKDKQQQEVATSPRARTKEKEVLLSSRTWGWISSEAGTTQAGKTGVETTKRPALWWDWNQRVPMRLEKPQEAKAGTAEIPWSHHVPLGPPIGHIYWKTESKGAWEL